MELMTADGVTLSVRTRLSIAEDTVDQPVAPSERDKERRTWVLDANQVATAVGREIELPIELVLIRKPLVAVGSEPLRF